MAGPWEKYGSSASQNPAGGYVPLSPADPTTPLKVEQLRGQISSQGISRAKTAAELNQLNATAPYDARKAAADARKAEAEAVAAQAKVEQSSPEQRSLQAALANDEILDAIAAARNDSYVGGSAGRWASLPAFFQPQSAINLAGALNTITSRLTLDKLMELKAASSQGASGLGALSEKEGALLRDSVAALGQTQDPARLRDNLAKVERHYRRMMALANGEDFRKPEIAERYGIVSEDDLRKRDDRDALGFANGGNRTEPDPALRGVNAHVRGMIGQGRPAKEIAGYLNAVQPGLGDKMAGDLDRAVAFRAQHPDVPLSRYPVSLENRSVPMSSTRQLVNKAAQGPMGAYAMNAGDAVTLGTLDNLMGNPTLARAGMDTIRRDNPVSSLLGTLSGGALGVAGIESGLAGAGIRAGVGALAPRALTADALYGAGYGAGSADEGSRGLGALSGALVGAAGGTLGRKAASALGGAFTGIRDPDVQFLRERNVPLTVGQMVGGAAKAREDRLAGFGGIGDRIGARRLEGMQGFNRAAFDEGLAPVGARVGNVGELGTEQAQGAVSDAYRRALSGPDFIPDQPFVNQYGSAVRSGSAIPGLGNKVRYTMVDEAGDLINGPAISGEAFQDLDRLLANRAAGFRKQYSSGQEVLGDKAEDALRAGSDALSGLVERQRPSALAGYQAAKRAYGNTQILNDAVIAARNTGGLFTPAQLGNSVIANTKRFGGKAKAASTDRPFFDLQRAGQNVLPSKIPDSGTAGRIEEGGGLYAALRRMTRNTLAAPLYAESTQPVLAAALLDRPDIAVNLGGQIRRLARPAGMFANPLALSYYGSGN